MVPCTYCVTGGRRYLEDLVQGVSCFANFGTSYVLFSYRKYSYKILHPTKIFCVSRRYIGKGKSQWRTSEIFDIPKSTVADIWKGREKITRHVTAAKDSAIAKRRCDSQFLVITDGFLFILFGALCMRNCCVKRRSARSFEKKY